MEWVNYGYKHLSMIFSNSPDIFQQKMIDFLQEFWFIRAYRQYFEYEKKVVGNITQKTGSHYM